MAKGSLHYVTRPVVPGVLFDRPILQQFCSDGQAPEATVRNCAEVARSHLPIAALTLEPLLTHRQKASLLLVVLFLDKAAS